MAATPSAIETDTGLRYRAENENLRSRINTLRSVIAGLFVVILVLWHGWEDAKKAARLFLPPDLRSGGMIHRDDPRPEHIYGFARYIFQLLNYWPRNGEEDYGLVLFKAQNYLTPACQDELRSDLEARAKRGELTDRKRAIHDVPGHTYEESSVEVKGNGVWIARIDFRIEEHVRGMPVKTVDIRYPIRVVAYDVSPEVNPFGLALDCFASPPERIEGSETSRPALPPIFKLGS